ncbi:MSCRAMM family protein [Actinoallomurus sp. NBC_01490]|uniref:MSCRAMM family protein n=1 Tax=Actinoallomurus sp. NBC_01490 TaxID=2903557 RepID=UPI003FA46C4F
MRGPRRHRRPARAARRGARRFRRARRHGPRRGGRAGEPAREALVILTDARGEVVATGTTGGDGAYAFARPAPGPYTLTVGAGARRPAAVPVEVGDGRTRQDVTMPPAARLRGVVRADGRGPLADARVTLHDAAGNVVGVATTGPDGAYAFGDLTGGRYTLTTSAYPPVTSPVVVDGRGEDTHDVWLGRLGR